MQMENPCDDVHIRVPTGFVMPSILQNMTPEFAAEALQALACFVEKSKTLVSHGVSDIEHSTAFLRMRDECRAEMERLQQKNLEMQDKTDNMYSTVQSQLDAVYTNKEEVHRECISILKSQVSGLTDERESVREGLRQQYERQLADVQAEKEKLQERVDAMSTHMQDRTDQQNDEIIRALDRFTCGASSRIGAGGQVGVLDALMREFPESSVEPVDSEAGQTDLMWVTDDGMQCMIEVKNVQALKNKTDMEKFTRDSISLTTSGRANALLFVSLRTNSIPRKGSFSIDMVNGCPCIYVANVNEAPALLGMAAHTLRYVWKKITNYADQGDEGTRVMERSIGLINTFMTQSYKCYASMVSGLVTRRRSIQTLQKQVDADERHLNDHMFRFDNITRQLDWIEIGGYSNGQDTMLVSDQTNKTQAMANLVDRILAFEEKEKRWPKRTDTDITETEARNAGGFRAVLTRAKRQRTASSVDDDCKRIRTEETSNRQ